jgi:arsenate reductase (glutaredoxin)
VGIVKRIVIYHNPKCSKSRKTLEYIKDQNITPKIKLYLQEEITVTEIKDLIKMLSIKPIDLIRHHEEEFKNYRNKDLSDEEIFTLLIKYPKLIERPIVVSNNKAILGRPPENVLDII